MPSFRKKLVVVEAVHLIEALSDTVLWPSWIHEALRRPAESPGSIYFPLVSGGPVIATLDGPMRVDHGDWIIRGVKGELYPCKPDIFEATYESADVASPATLIEAQRTEIMSLKATLMRGLRGARVHDLGDHERWVGVSDTFGYGCTSSIELCKEYGFNPHEIVKGAQCPTCMENQ